MGTLSLFQKLPGIFQAAAGEDAAVSNHMTYEEVGVIHASRVGMADGDVDAGQGANSAL